MKKQLNTSNIVNELRGASPFFPAAKEETKQKATTPPTMLPQKEVVEPKQTEPTPSIERYHDTMTPRNHATTVSLADEDIVEMARKAVKQIGKEAATHRFTLDEKHMLADIEYNYRKQGLRTSENEITRIAVNYFAQDYRKNGENSLLARILNRLNS